MTKAVFLFAVSLFGCVMCGNAFGERVRGPVVELVTITGPEETVFSVTTRDLVAVFVAGDLRICRGFEIDITLPRRLAEYRDGFVLMLYRNVFPEPTHTNLSYGAESSDFVHLRGQSSSTFDVLMDRETEIPGHVTLSRAETHDSPFLFAIEPISKAIPDSLVSDQIEVIVRGIFRDLGLIKLDIVAADDPLPAFEVFLDGDNVPFQSDGYIVEPGTHRVRVYSPSVVDFSEDIEISRGETADVRVIFGSPLPAVTIAAPENASIFLDGQRYRPEIHGEVRIAEGEHIVLVQMGDYAVSKRFTAERGREYAISLFLDILIEEKR